MHDSITARKYFASAVLADGRFVVAGGEYSDASGSTSQDDTNRCEIYDPVADFWTAIASPPISQVGDAACCMLANGKLLIGDLNSPQTFTLDPSTLTWSTAGAGGQKAVRASEESWTMMGDGTVVTAECVNAPKAEKYDPATDRWVTAGQLVANIVETSSLEIGAGVLLPDGRAFFVGANSGRTALYTSGQTPAAPGTWSAGPNIPSTRIGQARGAKDGPAALEPGGKVLFPAAPLDGVSGNYLPPCTFYEFDGANLAPVTNAPNSVCPTYVGRLLVIPTGEILWSREDDRHMYLFRSSDSPDNGWRPVITAVPATLARGTTVTITGAQFNGLSHASAYGDDHTPATNYPIVRIRNQKTGRVHYCRTANHSTMGVATGATTVSTQVTISLAADTGPSTLFVVANGIESEGASVNVV
ncbi:MAG TPA: kelch repeat-containing protein [Thermoanaerobaculia bacterium]|jgi:hypothetical protein|nr:kelch repeat-containing protein [Thermoanaerobaculia bacterium]